jgi:hypothetical protein
MYILDLISSFRASGGILRCLRDRGRGCGNSLDELGRHESYLRSYGNRWSSRLCDCLPQFGCDGGICR